MFLIVYIFGVNSGHPDIHTTRRCGHHTTPTTRCFGRRAICSSPETTQRTGRTAAVGGGAAPAGGAVPVAFGISTPGRPAGRSSIDYGRRVSVIVISCLQSYSL